MVCACVCVRGVRVRKLERDTEACEFSQAVQCVRKTFSVSLGLIGL